MPRLALTQGDYTARSIIANAQRAVNLYAEKNPPDAEAPFTHYNVPGLIGLADAPSPAAGRGLYWANSGELYGVVGSGVYLISPNWTSTLLGTIGTSAGLVSMADNGQTLVLVDNSSAGYQIDLAMHAFSQISAATNAPPPLSGAIYAFYGATRVDMLDGFMLLNEPGTRNFYSTYNNEIVFDSLYIAAKNGYSDKLVTIIVTRREIWLIGERTTELWFDAGDATFPFEIVPGPFIMHGCVAPFSVAQIDGNIFWLSQDQAGRNIIVRGSGYKVTPISTFALQNEIDGYSTVSDAEGFCFQIDGHFFYQLNFPSQNVSWRWDETTNLWHQAVYTDHNGGENRHRAGAVAFAYGINVAQDWETGRLYQLTLDAYLDDGAPMYFRRGFPHLMQDGKRVIYPGFVLDVQAGTSPDPVVANAPLIYLRWSDDRGETYSNPIAQSLGSAGQYLSQPQWNRLGMARDRVFEVFGVIPGKLAINGAFLDPSPIVLKS